MRTKHIFVLILTLVLALGLSSFLTGKAPAAAATEAPTAPAEITTLLTTVDDQGDVGEYVSLAIRGDGYRYISYYDAEDGDLKLAGCDDATCTNRMLTTIDSDGDVGSHTSLALNGSGFPVISYHDAWNKDLKLAVCNNPTCDNPTLVTVDSAGDTGEHTTLALTKDGFPVISYFNYTYKNLRLAVCDDVACTNPVLTTVDSTAFVGTSNSLALGEGGVPVISYYDFGNQDLKLALCKDAACSAPNLVTVDSAGQVGKYPSLVLDSRGYPVISYLDLTNTALKLAWCNDPACSAPDLVTIDDLEEVGSHTSLALNEKGYPVISYYDMTIGGLKVAVCNDAACANPLQAWLDDTGDAGLFSSLALNGDGYPTIAYHSDLSALGKGKKLKMATCRICFPPITQTVVSAGNVGAYTSLVLDEHDFPVISFIDVTSDDLKLAVCADPLCESKTLRTIDSNGINRGYTSLALDRNGHPFISYWNDGNLKLAVCEDRTCTNPTLTTIDNVGGFNLQYGGGISLALDNNDLPRIAYYDWDLSGVFLAVCNNRACTNPDLILVDGGIGYSSFALDANGNAVISYQGGNGALMLAQCPDPNCSSPTLKTIDFGWGEFISMALDSRGLPVISYHGPFISYMELAFCDDSNCSDPKWVGFGENTLGFARSFKSLALDIYDNPMISFWFGLHEMGVVVCNGVSCPDPTVLYLHSPEKDGAYNSLAVDNLGYPVISYYDQDNGDLKLARFVPSPEAGFSADPTSGISPLQVNFSDNSNGLVDTWLWDFGDGDTSTERNPSHTFASDGVYPVSLTVTGPGGQDTLTKVDYIDVTEPPTPTPTPSPTPMPDPGSGFSLHLPIVTR